jgi:hypothetical protein
LAKATWPACVEAIQALHKGMDTPVLHRNRDVSEKTKKKNVRKRLAAVLKAGLIVEVQADEDDEATSEGQSPA